MALTQSTDEELEDIRKIVSSFHDGTLHDEAAFDHIFYTQNEPKQARSWPTEFWMPSNKAAFRYLRVRRTHGMVDWKAPCFRASLVGRWRNSDILVRI
jgi:hypothetical protein